MKSLVTKERLDTFDTVDSEVLGNMYSRKDERDCRTLGGEEIGMSEIVNFIEEVKL